MLSLHWSVLFRATIAAPGCEWCPSDCSSKRRGPQFRCIWPGRVQNRGVARIEKCRGSPPAMSARSTSSMRRTIQRHHESCTLNLLSRILAATGPKAASTLCHYANPQRSFDTLPDARNVLRRRAVPLINPHRLTRHNRGRTLDDSTATHA